MNYIWAMMITSITGSCIRKRAVNNFFFATSLSCNVADVVVDVFADVVVCVANVVADVVNAVDVELKEVFAFDISSSNE